MKFFSKSICRFAALSALIVASVGLCSDSCDGQVRTWTDSSGTYQLNAELVLVHEVRGELQAELVQDNGKRMAIPVSKLSDGDRKLAREFHTNWIGRGSKSEIRQVSRNVELSEVTPLSTKFESSLPEAKRVPKKLASEKTDSVKLLRIPEEHIVSRPIRSPVSMSVDAAENLLIGDVDFDADTAVRLEREIARDKKGRAIENPAYLVDVDTAELKLMPKKFSTTALLLNDKRVAIDQKRRAIETLSDSWPNRRYPNFIGVIVNCLSDKDKFLRLAALDLLANHDSELSLHYILARIDDVSFDVRWRTYEVLTQLRDPRIIPELCERLNTADRRKIASVLQVFGTTSNRWIHPWLEKQDVDEDSLLEICKILGSTGDLESAQALSGLSDHKSKLVRRQAKFAIRQIEKRTKPTASK
jgi:hypothetical protein